MPRLVTCDEVFDVLTRGPFPTGGRDDVEVERHLDGCHDCRQLAEALRPAAGLLRESLSESRLPAYRGRAGREQPWLEPPASASRRGFLVGDAARLAAAALLIAALCVAAGVAGKLRSAAPLSNAQLRARLAATPLTSVCWEAFQEPVAANACCTRCHTAADPQSAPSGRLLALSCRSCHE